MNLNFLLPRGFRDRRERKMCIQKALIGTVAFLWFVAIAIADTDLNEHAQSIMTGQWWVIGGLLGVIQIIILTFYAYSQRSNERANRIIIDRMDKMDARQEHKEELLLETRRVLLELHGEHKAMMERCTHINQLSKHERDLG